MPKYLNNIDLNGNQLLSPVIHVSSQSTTTNGPAGDTTGTEGQIFYNSHSSAKALYFRDDSGWRPIGDISGVTAGAGLSGGGAGGTVSLAIDISEFSDVTPANGDKILTLDSDGSTEQLTTIAALATLFAGSGLTATNSVIAVDTLNQDTTGEAGSVANSLTVDNTTVQLNTGTTYNGSAALTLSAKTAAIANGGAALATADQIHTFVTTQTDAIAASTTGNAATVTTNANLSGHITSSGNTTSLGSFTTAQLNAAISDGTINSQTLPTDFVSAANGGTFSGNVSFGDNNISNVGIITLDKVDADGATITIGDQQSKSIVIGKTHPGGTTNGTSVSVEQDLTVKGKLVVQGDIQTSSTTNTEIKDAIIQITGADASTANTSDIGFVFERGTSGNVAIAWDEGANPGAFKLIATGDTASSANIAMTNQGGDNSDENTAGGATPAGYQTLYAGKIRAVGSVGTAGFYGDGANITGMTAANISAGTLAVARGGTGVTSMTALKNALDGETWTFANTVTLSGSLNIGGHSVDDIDLAGEFVDSDNHLMSSAAINDRITSFGYTTNTGTTTAGNTQTFTNKSIDADNNTLSNIEVDNFKASAIVTESEAIGSNDNDTTIPTSAAVKDYVDNATSSSGNTGGRQAFSLNNSASGVAVSNSNKTYTITHGMGASLNYGVEVIRAANGSGETVYTDVTRTTTTIVIDFAVAPTAGDYTALVCKY